MNLLQDRLILRGEFDNSRASLAGSTFASCSNNVGSELLMAAKSSPATLFLEATGTNSRLNRAKGSYGVYFHLQEHGQCSPSPAWKCPLGNKPSLSMSIHRLLLSQKALTPFV